MTQYTIEDLAVRTMRDLNLIAAQEVPDPNDLLFVEETIRSEFASMEADGLDFANHNTTVNSINHVLFTALSERMGHAISAAFGVENAATAMSLKAASENKLRRLLAPVKTPELLTVERAARGTKIRDPIISQ